MDRARRGNRRDCRGDAGGRLIESLLARLAELPPLLVYVLLGLVAALENVIPPIPSDAAVALGAFLSHRGVTTPLLVFLVVWVCNVAGAIGVYYAARKYGRRIFDTGAGRRLLTPRSLAAIEREYLRFGVVGIFLARFLPGFRAVVAPFAGIMALPAQRAIVPMALASALWYGGLTILGTALGAEWSRIAALLSGANHTLAALAVVAALVVLFRWLVRRRRERHAGVWLAVQRALGHGALPGVPIQPKDAAMLVLELAYADDTLTAADRDAIARHLCERWELHAPAPMAPPGTGTEPLPLAGYRARLEARFGRERRLELVEQMWQAAFADADLDATGSRVMQRAGELLGIDPAELTRLRGRLGQAP